MYLALTYDHRLVDGREAVSFLCSVRDKVADSLELRLFTHSENSASFVVVFVVEEFSS